MTEHIERDAFSPEAQRACAGGDDAHLAHLSSNGECPWCGAYTDTLAAKIKLPQWRISVEQPTCLDAHRDAEHCSGSVEYRESLSGTGTPIPRCDAHWSKRLDEQQRINERYPQRAPADFDPLYAGERWDEDDY